MNIKDSKLNEDLKKAIKGISSFDMNSFIEYREMESFRNQYSQLRIDAKERSDKLLYKVGIVNKELKANMDEFIRDYDSFPSNVKRHNRQLAKKLSLEIGRRINPVEGYDLDSQQLFAIAIDMDTRLVIAGAGTGKTTTVVGLVKELLSSGKAKPNEILLLSFTNAAVNELNERITKETTCEIKTSTFHKLGLDIITECEGKVPKITKTELTTFISESIQKKLSDPDYIRCLNEYILFEHNLPFDEDHFNSNDDYVRYLKENALITLNGERVKSHGEADIANFLAMNGIPYVYEDSYKVGTNDSQHAQYHPDFHIVDTDLYIEYYGIDRNNDIANFMKRSNPNANAMYLDGIKWKRSVHQHNGTRLIELHYYDREEGTLLDILEKELKKENIHFNPVSPDIIFEKMVGRNNFKRTSFITSFSTGISLIKGKGTSWSEAFPISDSRKEMASLRRIEKVLKPLYDDYQSHLAKNDEIDFQDMLTIAIKCVRNGSYVHCYRYVIIDEYQDVSQPRFELIKAMRQSRDFKLFCVGDDWQSIYRFNGCNVSYIMDFEDYWGPSEICKIETTYRFSGELLRKSSEFICSNPRQVKKNLVSNKDEDSIVVTITGKSEPQVFQKLMAILDSVNPDKEILFLGRYHHDVVCLGDAGLRWNQDIHDDAITLHYEERPELNIKFMTIHGSKGLQSDIVFIVNNKKGSYGFPSHREESILISKLLNNRETRLDEERRLFYVAMTRARNAVYLITIEKDESEFCKELNKKEKNKTAKKNKSALVCPICGGNLVLRKGKYGPFYGCSNYYSLGCRYKKSK